MMSFWATFLPKQRLKYLFPFWLMRCQKQNTQKQDTQKTKR